MTKEMMTFHAQERALERYGFVPSLAEVATLLAACGNGRAPCMKSNALGRVHIGAVRGKCMVFALRPDEDVIITFLPHDYFQPQSRAAHKKQLNGGRWKTAMKPHVAAEKPTYSRARVKRERLDADGDE